MENSLKEGGRWVQQSGPATEQVPSQSSDVVGTENASPEVEPTNTQATPVVNRTQTINWETREITSATDPATKGKSGNSVNRLLVN